MQEEDQYSKFLNKITEMTIYVCSRENLTKRSKEDVENIVQMIKKFILYFKEKNQEIHDSNVKINIAGDYLNSKLPNKIKDDLNAIVKETKSYTKYQLNLAICYDPRIEVLRSSQSVPKNVSELFERLYVKNDIDLVFRTGYEKRTSGFFPMQTLYAEWFFIDKHWPEISLELIKQLLQDYEKRERRMGA